MFLTKNRKRKNELQSAFVLLIISWLSLLRKGCYFSFLFFSRRTLTKTIPIPFSIPNFPFSFPLPISLFPMLHFSFSVPGIYHSQFFFPLKSNMIDESIKIALWVPQVLSSLALDRLWRQFLDSSSRQSPLIVSARPSIVAFLS